MSKPLMISPHAANSTKESDVTVSEWPVTTRSLLADCEKMSAMPTEEVNQPLLALVKARKAINDAKLSCMFAMRFHGERQPVVERLSEISVALKQAHDSFPLTLLENAQGRPRRHIMAGHDTVDRPTPWGVE